MANAEVKPRGSVLAHEPSQSTVVAVFVALMIAMVIGSLDQTIVSTALPTIVGELGGMSHLLWVTTAYVLASTITMPVYGKVGDMIGRKGLFILSQVLFLVGSIMCGAATDMGLLIAGRAVAGLGGGGSMVLSQAIVADIVPARKRALYLNVMGIGWALPMLVGPLLGGVFTDLVSWRWAFWINIPLSIVAIAVSVVLLPAYRKRESLKNFDFWGMTFIAAAVCTLTLATSWGGVEYAWDSPVIIALIVATVVLAVLFAVAENRSKHALMPLFLFKSRNFVLTTVGGFIVLFATMAAMSYLPTYFQIAHGMSATAAGYMEVPMSIAYLVASLISGVLISKSGRYKKLMAVSFIIATVGTLFIATLTADTSVVFVGIYLSVMGFGMGLSFEVLVLIVQNEFPAAMVGVATSATNFFREIGTTLGASVAGAIFTANLTGQLAEKLAPLGGVDALGFDVNSLTPALVHMLPDTLQHAVAVAYNDALMPVFLLMVPLTIGAGLCMMALKETPLADSLREQGASK